MRWGVPKSQMTIELVLKVACGRRYCHNGTQVCQIIFKKNSFMPQMFFEGFVMKLGIFKYQDREPPRAYCLLSGECRNQ